MLILWLRSFSWVRRISAKAWSLNGRTTRVGSRLLFSVCEGTGCSVLALMAINRVMVEFKDTVNDDGSDFSKFYFFALWLDKLLKLKLPKKFSQNH